MPTATDEAWLKIGDVARILNISVGQTRRLVTSGRLRAKDMSLSGLRHQWRVHPVWLREFQECTVEVRHE